MATMVHAVAADLPAVTEVLSEAFRDDPVQQWFAAVAPDPDAARRTLFGLLVEDYFQLGHTYVVAGTTGAALWAPPDRNVFQGDRVNDLLQALGPHLGDELIPRLSELSRAFEFRPAEPHLYLGILGVDPARQSKGLGGDLLRPVLAWCDEMRLLAHLESSNPRNIPFYERHGFVTKESYRCGGPDGPLMTMMSRQPV